MQEQEHSVYEQLGEIQAGGSLEISFTLSQLPRKAFQSFFPLIVIYEANTKEELLQTEVAHGEHNPTYAKRLIFPQITEDQVDKELLLEIFNKKVSQKSHMGSAAFNLKELLLSPVSQLSLPIQVPSGKVGQGTIGVFADLLKFKWPAKGKVVDISLRALASENVALFAQAERLIGNNQWVSVYRSEIFGKSSSFMELNGIPLEDITGGDIDKIFRIRFFADVGKGDMHPLGSIETSTSKLKKLEVGEEVWFKIEDGTPRKAAIFQGKQFDFRVGARSSLEFVINLAKLENNNGLRKSQGISGRSGLIGSKPGKSGTLSRSGFLGKKKKFFLF